MLERVFERVPDAVIIFSANAQMVHVNDAARALFGDDAAISRFFFEYTDALALAGEVERGSIEREGQLRRNGLPPAEIELRFFPVFDGASRSGIGVVARDVSADRTAERRFRESQQRFRSLYERQPDPVILLDRDGTISTFNVATTKSLGYQIEDLVGRSLVVVVASGDRERTRRRFESALNSEASCDELTLYAKDGTAREVAGNFVPVVVEGAIVGAYLVAVDLSIQKRAERSAVVQSQRLRALYLAAAAKRDPESQLSETLALGLRLLGFDLAAVCEIEGDEVVIRFSTDEAVYPVGARYEIGKLYIRRSVEENRIVAVPDVESPPWSSDPAYGPRPWRAIIGSAFSALGRPYGVVSFYSRTPRMQIEETDKDLVGMIGVLCGSAIDRMEHERHLDALAFLDPLTGLPNRLLLKDRLTQTIIAAKRQTRQFALMYLDLDHFKEVNDAHGHSVGDHVLQVVAKRLETALRESDTVARMSGDEFVILQPTIRSSADAFELSRRVLAEMEEPIFLGGTTIEISASIGIAFFPEDAEDPDELIHCADSALYRAKAEGRGRASAYVSELAKGPEEA